MAENSDSTLAFVQICTTMSSPCLKSLLVLYDFMCIQTVHEQVWSAKSGRAKTQSAPLLVTAMSVDLMRS